MTVETIVAQVLKLGVKRVTVTGGEPLAQPDVHTLMQELCDLDMAVSIETSGALDVSKIDPRVVKVLDFKTPGSGESHRNMWANVAHLSPTDQIKFVLCDRQDYEWAKLKCDEHQLYERVADVLMSPSFGELDATDLANWIVTDKLEVRMQLQLHKLLWGDEPGR